MSINNLTASTSANGSGSGSGSGLLMPSAGLEDRSKKSQNMTECVPVPSSEHVAEIVGRQGCKIKALRAKTNTYIKTPVRGEEPVFVVTGRKEDVNKAKREILSAADHFSLIRASRKPSMAGLGSGNSNAGSLNVGVVTRTQNGPPCLPGQITIQVRVPYRVVGLVVGPKGATIKHIQQETQTYIVTPSREKEPIFEVTGLPENVETARKQIEAHIALRTGNSNSNSNCNSNSNSNSNNSSEFATLHTINTLTQILNDDINSDILSSIYKIDATDPTSSYTCADNSLMSMSMSMPISIPMTMPMTMSMPVKANLSNCYQNSELIETATASTSTSTSTSSSSSTLLPVVTGSISENNACKLNANANNNNNNIGNVNTSSLYRNKTLSFCPPTSTSVSCHLMSSNILTRSCSSASSTASTKSTNNSANSTNSANTPPELLNIWKNINDSIDVDEGIGDSPSIWNLPTATAVNVNVNVNVNATASTSHCSPTASISPTDSLLGDTTKSTKIPDANSLLLHHQHSHQMQMQMQMQKNRECFVCNEREVTTALVPCGHNMFCMDCANQICVSMESICPICHSIVYHAMRILA
ncbi:RNA-binding protein MEX3B [Drosophila innubila]|uniref:RNA-binding protein MEX3B n=1 Tax=Drosophila innubila TaxID=198719 RepID=UPI00148DBDE1|nr:RNA-binding protein MEX3B [Drosophila innubila]